jgi:dinuclear metal center YbgI/SA1388 family protein
MARRKTPKPAASPSSTVADLVAAMDRLAPPGLAESWDNVGLLLGRHGDPVSKVLLCIDLMPEVVDEAVAREVDAVIAYHPPIFSGLKSITDATPQNASLLTLIQAGIAVHSPHTAADAAPGGVNDWLADGLGDGTREALHPAEVLPSSERFKIVTFAPTAAIDEVRTAMAAAGAGHIGDYDTCATEVAVTGLFRGGETTNPVVGKRGRLERVPETRLEMVCGSAALGAAIEALRATHPYEEPPIEVHPLAPRPDPSIGAGRLVTLDRPATVKTLVERLRDHLGTNRFSVHEPDRRRKHAVIGMCAGSGAELMPAAFDRGATLFLTGELKHHDVLDAARRDAAVILAGHTNTERGWLKVLRKTLRRAMPSVEFDVSKTDRDPLRTA